jgi:hypothetical protein
MRRALLAAALGLAPFASWAAEPVHVRANAAFAACLEPAVSAFNRTGQRAVVDVGDPDPAPGADLVVGDDTEMTRLLESGRAAGAVDLGYLPWVMVSPAGASAQSMPPEESLAVFAGRAGAEARQWASGLGPARVRLSRDRALLASARWSLVPRSLAGAGARRAVELRPLVATAAVIKGSPRAAAARALLAFLRAQAGAGGALRACLDPAPVTSSTAVRAPAASFAQGVVDWWLPQCSIDRNSYNDPGQVLGAPDAVDLRGADNYTGIMSMGQGGWVVVDMGVTAVDGAGADIRVYQVTTGEPVTVYAADSPGGPFILVGLRVFCGVRSPGLAANHCDFDLRAGGLAQARYLKVEDGEIYPCLAGDTRTEGADIDAVEVLNAR